MARGGLWFSLSLGSGLMVAAAQQLLPQAPAFWLAILALGAAIVLAAIGPVRRARAKPMSSLRKSDE